MDGANLLEGLIDLLLIGGTGLWGRATAASKRAARPPCSQVWDAYAEDHQLTRGTTAQAAPRMTGAVDGVRIDMAVVVDADWRKHTRLQAEAIAPLACELDLVSVHGPMDRTVRARPDFKPARTGDPDFDAAVVVRAHPEDAARTLLHERVRALAMTFYGRGFESLIYRQGIIALQWAGAEDDRAMIDAALDLAVELAQVRPSTDQPYRE